MPVTYAKAFNPGYLKISFLQNPEQVLNNTILLYDIVRTFFTRLFMLLTIDLDYKVDSYL